MPQGRLELRLTTDRDLPGAARHGRVMWVSVSVAGRPADLRKGYIMGDARTTTGRIVSLGFDVGKASHWACGLDAQCAVVLSEPVANRPDAIDGILARAPGALVVVDQKRNIGALVIARARKAGNPLAYLPGSAEKTLREAMRRTAKTDKIDAEVIALSPSRLPEALAPLADAGAHAEELRALASQPEFCTRSRTRAKNRLRAVLLEADPALEAAVDPSCAWHLAVLSLIGGPAECAAAGVRRFRSVAEKHGAGRAASDRLWAVMAAAPRQLRATGLVVRSIAADIVALGGEMSSMERAMAEELEGDETYRCLLTVPGVGPKTAAALVSSIDISLFASDDKLASFCGLAPADSQSGKCTRHAAAQRGGSRPLKNLLVFSCNSLVGTKNRFGRYYDQCRGRNMRHNMALKAVARKRLRVIYAIMKNPRPYSEPAA